MSDKRYRECMAAIVGVLKKYDMAGAITVVSKERCVFKYHFPTWSVVTVTPDYIRFCSKREELQSLEAQHVAIELSAHIVVQMRDVAATTFIMMERIGKELRDSIKFGMVHVPNADPERDQ